MVVHNTSVTKNTSYASPQVNPSMMWVLRSLALTANDPFLATFSLKTSCDDGSTKSSAVTVAGATLAEDGTTTKCASPSPMANIVQRASGVRRQVVKLRRGMPSDMYRGRHFDGWGTTTKCASPSPMTNVVQIASGVRRQVAMTQRLLC